MIVVAGASAAAAAATAYGAKKGVDAYKDNKEAKRKRKQAKYIFDKAKIRLNKARKDTKEDLENLGRARLEAWREQVGRFVNVFEQLRQVDVGELPQTEEFDIDRPSSEQISGMKEASLEAEELATDGGKALSAGALAGIGSYGAASGAATASTGTAISSLSGAAAQSATLAWFGGGAAAAGGGGVAAGAAVLGGLTAAPVLAVGGMLASSKAQKNLANAKKVKAKAKKAAEEMKTARSVTEGIGDVARQHTDFIEEFRSRMDRSLGALEHVIRRHGPNYQAMGDTDRRVVHVAVQFAQVMKAMLTTPLLDENGSLSPASTDALESGRRFMSKTPIE